MKIESKITLSDILYVVFILFCLFLTIGSSIGGWWYLSDIGFSVKQLLINILVSSSALFMVWVIFIKIFIIKINRIKVDEKTGEIKLPKRKLEIPTDYYL